MPTIPVRLAAFALALAAAGCGSDSAATTTSPTTTTPTATTDTFVSSIAVRGSAARTFITSSNGAVKVTLSTLGNGSGMVGLGIGVPATSAPCSLAQSIVTGPGSAPQIVTSADAGVYCVQLFDAGRLTEDTAFTLTVEHF